MSLVCLAQNALGSLLENILLNHGRSLGGKVGTADAASGGGDVFRNVGLVLQNSSEYKDAIITALSEPGG